MVPLSHHSPIFVHLLLSSTSRTKYDQALREFSTMCDKKAQSVTTFAEECYTAAIDKLVGTQWVILVLYCGRWPC